MNYVSALSRLFLLRAPLRCRVSRSLFTMEQIDYTLSSPLLDSCGFTEDDLESSGDLWSEAAERIVDSLQFDRRFLTPPQKTRVYHYYLPIVMWISRLKKESTRPGPLMLGMSAPQGCGKSTLVECLMTVSGKMGMRAACVSIDDFYLTREEQKRVAAEYKENPLLQCRGNALTHDVALGTHTLEKLKSDQSINRDNLRACLRFGRKGDDDGSAI